MSRLDSAVTTWGWTFSARSIASFRVTTGTFAWASAWAMESCACLTAALVGVTAPNGGWAGEGLGAGCCAASEKGTTRAATIDLTTTICLPRTVPGGAVLPGAPALEGRLLVFIEYL